LAAPVLGHRLVPVRVRVVLAAILAAALVPAVGAAPFTPPADLWSLGGMLAAESALGVLLGLVAQFIFAGVQLGGQLTGIQMGFGIANLIDPQSHAQVTIIAQWQQLMTLLAFLVLDAHHLLIRALLESFRTAPPGAVGLAAAGVGRAIELAGSLFVLGARIAAPVLIVLLLTNGASACWRRWRSCSPRSRSPRGAPRRRSRGAGRRSPGCSPPAVRSRRTTTRSGRSSCARCSPSAASSRPSAWPRRWSVPARWSRRSGGR